MTPFVNGNRSSAAERFIIGFAVVTGTLGLRILIIFARRPGAGEVPIGDMRLVVAAYMASLLLLPQGLALVERLYRRATASWWRVSGVVLAYGCLSGIAAPAIFALRLLLVGETPPRPLLTRFAYQQASWNIVLLLIAHGIQRAIESHRATRRERERQHDIEMAEAKNARRTIESRTRPDTVIATLESIAERAVNDPAAARLLLLRLARHQRMLLTRPSPPSFEDELRIVRSTVTLFRPNVHLAIGRCDVLPDVDVDAVQPWLRAVERALILGPDAHYLVDCERREESAVLRISSPDGGALQTALATFELPLNVSGAQPNPPAEETSRGFSSASGSGAFTAALVVYLLTAIVPDRRPNEQVLWNLTAMTLTSAVSWLAIGPLVAFTTKLCIRLRLALSVLFSSAAALCGAAAVTAASFVVLRLITGADFTLSFLPLVASRNANVAFVICTSSFVDGLSRLLIAARADAMRSERETVRAEARELEARFQPHFLFNALTSIAGLIRLNAGAAGEVCRLLARLVARTSAHAGVPSWSVDEEIMLIADYIAIQRRRFAERFRIAWQIAPSTRDVAIPRLSLQPLVENVFIHAVAASYDVITIGLTIEPRDGMLAVDIWNDVAEGPPSRGHGRGLAFVANRVRDAGGRMLVVPAADRFAVHLTIPITP